MFSACRNCPRSAIQAQEEVLDPCCEPYAVFTFVGFLHWIKESGSLQSHSLAAFSCRGGQSVITYFCVDKLSELQISLVGELTSAIILILSFCGEFTFSWNLWNWFRSWTRDWIRFSTKRLFSRRAWLYSRQYTYNAKIWFIYLLFFWNNFLKLTFFLVIWNCELPVLLSDQ